MKDNFPDIDVGIITDYNDHWCDEHMEDLEEWDIPPMNAVVPALALILESGRFFKVAYRKKNGYDMPDDLCKYDVPESEKPGNEHIQEAIQEISPICCFITDNVENKWEDEPAPQIVTILAAKAAEED